MKSLLVLVLALLGCSRSEVKSNLTQDPGFWFQTNYAGQDRLASKSDHPPGILVFNDRYRVDFRTNGLTFLKRVYLISVNCSNCWGSQKIALDYGRTRYLPDGIVCLECGLTNSMLDSLK